MSGTPRPDEVKMMRSLCTLMEKASSAFWLGQHSRALPSTKHNGCFDHPEKAYPDTKAKKIERTENDPK